MLIGFLVRDEDDWEDLKQRVREGSSRGKIIHVFDRDPTIKETEREGAEEEVESFDEI
ncbi:hypothetical protein TRV_05525 [Trichophyton verrucosum HKI 0517]|uniref:Uncharacterized protein n=1 Tax=Trichophyton verrucosum (strain HKI 0517) TaxID=663202 RepID=D4DEF8_TRIVH|nr:uncharacterized protein TRV_05525 [Trichophyton verrucosum HKI 0517]EFE39789.1 hypothetical protein TRV_05525 [Trichophyton verrucosum HKI 0517]